MQTDTAIIIYIDIPTLIGGDFCVLLDFRAWLWYYNYICIFAGKRGAKK